MKRSILKTKVAKNGQVVLPKPIRLAMGLKHGDLLAVDIDKPSGVVRLYKDLTSFSSLVGALDEKDLSNTDS